MKTNIKIICLLLVVLFTSCTKEEIVNREAETSPLTSVGTSGIGNWTTYSDYSRVEVNIVVEGLEGRTNEVELKLKAQVSNIDYLDFYLISPSNQLLPIMGNIIQDNPGQITIDVTLTDKGPNLFDDWDQTSTITGSYYPAGDSGYAIGLAFQNLYQFKGFNDQNPNGQWKVLVKEKALGAAYAFITDAELFISTKY